MSALLADNVSAFGLALIMADMAAGAVIMSVSVCRINVMGSRTDHLMRLAFIVLSAGGFSLLVAPLFADIPPTWPQAISHFGFAVMLLAERRRSGGCCPKKERT